MVLATILRFATYGRQPIHLPRAVRLIAYYRSWLSGQYASDLLNPTRTFLSFSLQLREYGKLQSANSAALSQFILHDLLCSSMSAEPPSKSTHLLPQLNKRPERQRPLPLARQRPQTFLFGQSGIRQAVFARYEILSKPASRMLSNERLRRRSKAHSSQEH